MIDDDASNVVLEIFEWQFSNEWFMVGHDNEELLVSAYRIKKSNRFDILKNTLIK